MKYNEDDFTVENYERLLDKITHQTIFYSDIEKYSEFTLWRHDLDFSIFILDAYEFYHGS